jgi:hypothetical protein
MTPIRTVIACRNCKNSDAKFATSVDGRTIACLDLDLDLDCGSGISGQVYPRGAPNAQWIENG